MSEDAADILQIAYLTARSAPEAPVCKEHAFHRLRKHVAWRCEDVRREKKKHGAGVASLDEVLKDEKDQPKNITEGPEDHVLINEAVRLFRHGLSPYKLAVL